MEGDGSLHRAVLSPFSSFQNTGQFSQRKKGRTIQKAVQLFWYLPLLFSILKAATSDPQAQHFRLGLSITAECTGALIQFLSSLATFSASVKGSLYA